MNLPASGLLSSTVEVYRETLDQYQVHTANIEVTDSIIKSLETSRFNNLASVHKHVISAGYGYANDIRQLFSIETDERKPSDSILDDINQMYKYTIDTIRKIPEIDQDDLFAIKFKVSWGWEYTIEQLFEHAIVHILKHTNQVKRMISLL